MNTLKLIFGVVPTLVLGHLAYFICIWMGWGMDLVVLKMPTAYTKVGISVHGILILSSIVFLLMFEIYKSIGFRNTSMVDHLTSTGLLVAGVLIFALVDMAATETYLILVVLTVVDVIAGVIISIAVARRDIGIAPQV